MFSTYDQWKLACPYDERSRDPKCQECEDAGCLECCPELPITLADLDEMDAQEATTP